MNAVIWLAHPGSHLVSFLIQPGTTRVGNGATRSGLSPPTAIGNHNPSLIDMPTGQSDLGDSSTNSSF